MGKISILLADDHRIVRDGLKLLLKGSDEISIVGEASNGLEALEAVNKLKPDVLLIDISMPHLTGIEVAAELTKAGSPTQVLILSMHEKEEYIIKAFEAGAKGYLLKDTEKEELVTAIKKIKNGETYYGNSIFHIMMNSYLQKKNAPVQPAEKPSLELTRREKEILKNITEGLSNKEIAQKLFISPRTVDTHRANIMMKLDVRNTAELVRIVLEKKLV